MDDFAEIKKFPGTSVLGERCAVSGNGVNLK